jgi:hypothetical protein
MRTRTRRLSVIGTAVGLALAVGVVVAPVSAPPASAAVGCSYFKGLTVTANSVSITGISLRAGESITAKASPAVAGDTIYLGYGIGMQAYIKSAPAITGITFTAPASSSYNLGWSFDSVGTRPSSITYSFTATCSSTTVSPSPSPTPTTTKPSKGGGKGKG